MRYKDLLSEDGRIVKGVNTTVDVGVNQIPIEASKFGNTVTKDGRPPTLSKKVKGKSTNVLYNLGLAESVTKQDLNAPTPTIQMLARKWKTSPKEILTQVKKGVKVEAEHTTDFDIAMEIALDHINEDPKYYDKLKFIEADSLGEIASSSQIYVDVDGVLADFFGEWARLMNVNHFTDINKQHDIDDALQKIRDTDDFWLRLPMLPESKKLLSLIKQVKGSYNICSSPLADDPNSEKHKRTWVEKNLSFFPPDNVYITHDKAQYATNEDGTPNILIDDYGVNIRKWEAAGGIGFKYKDHKFERTAKELKQHMQEPVQEGVNEGSLRMPTGQLRGMIIQMLQDMETQQDTATLVKIARLLGKEVYFMKKGDQVVLQDPDFDFYAKESVDALVNIYEKWSQKYKRSINCNNPKGFSQKAHCAGRKKNEDIDENFADGKRKGKSRPGRVKRAGASCNGSVTALRKRAKNASGEKAKMYHWCANMKSGRKK